jgi:hypothetical protein
MLVNDVTLNAMQGDVFRFTVLPHEDLTGLPVRCDIRANGTVVKHLTNAALGGITVGSYDPVTNTTLVTLTVGASVTATWVFATARFDVEVVPVNPEETHKIAKGIISLMTEETHD